MSRMQNSMNEVKNNSTVFVSNNGKRLPFGRFFLRVSNLPSDCGGKEELPKDKRDYWCKNL